MSDINLETFKNHRQTFGKRAQKYVVSRFCTDTKEFDGKKEIDRPLNSKSIGVRRFQVADISEYHYLNGKLGAGVRCYVALYESKPIAFIAVACTRMKVKYYRVSCSVVLPDYQGIGVGKNFLNFRKNFTFQKQKCPPTSKQAIPKLSEAT